MSKLNKIIIFFGITTLILIIGEFAMIQSDPLIPEKLSGTLYVFLLILFLYMVITEIKKPPVIKKYLYIYLTKKNFYLIPLLKNKDESWLASHEMYVFLSNAYKLDEIALYAFQLLSCSEYENFLNKDVSIVKTPKEIDKLFLKESDIKLLSLMKLFENKFILNSFYDYNLQSGKFDSNVLSEKPFKLKFLIKELESLRNR